MMSISKTTISSEDSYRYFLLVITNKNCNFYLANVILYINALRNPTSNFVKLTALVWDLVASILQILSNYQLFADISSLNNFFNHLTGEILLIMFLWCHSYISIVHSTSSFITLCSIRVKANIAINER